MFDFLKKLKKDDEEEDLSILEELKGEHNINSEIPSDVSIEPANNQLNPPSLNDLSSQSSSLSNDFNKPQPPLMPNSNNLLTFANNQPQQPPLPTQPASQPPLNYQNNLTNSLEDEIREIKLKIEVLANKIEKIETKLELIYNLLAYNR